MRLDTRNLADVPRLEAADELSDKDCSWRNSQYGRNVCEDFEELFLPVLKCLISMK